MPSASSTPGRIFVYLSSSEVQSGVGWTGPILPDSTMLALIGRWYSHGATDLILYGIDSSISGGFFSAAAILHLQRFCYLCSLWGIKVHIAIQVSNSTYGALWSYNTTNAPSALEKLGFILEDEWWNNGFDDFVRIRDLTTTWQPLFISSGTEYGPYTGFTKENGDSYGEDYAITNVVAGAGVVTFTTSVNHGFLAGGTCEIVGVTGFTNNPNGQFVMTAAAGNTFQISHFAGAGSYVASPTDTASSVYVGPGEILEMQSLFTNWYLHDYVIIPRYSQMRSRMLQFSVPVNVAAIPSMESTTATPPQANNFSGNFRMGQDSFGVVQYPTKSYEQVYQYIFIDTQALGLVPNQSGTPRCFNLETDPGILANVTIIGIVIFSGTMEVGRAVTDGARIMVTAGADQSFGSTIGAITLSDSYAYDDWLPIGSSLTYLWTVVSSPGGGTYSFSDTGGVTSNILHPTFNFAAAALGNYVLRLAVSDGVTTSSNEMTLLIDGASGAMTVTVVELRSSTCQGDCDGEAICTAVGGVAPYTYVWSAGTLPLTRVSGVASDTQTGLCAGTVSCTVTDSTGIPLTASDSDVITAPAALVVTLTPTNPTCPSGADGEIVMVVSGGTPPMVSEAWTRDAVAIFPADPYHLINLDIGLYEVTVTDSNACVQIASVNIIEPVAITQVNVITAPSCFGQTDGDITITVSGGTGTYTYVWLDPTLTPVPGSPTTKLVGVYAGAWTVEATDSMGCTQSFVFNVIDPDPIIVLLTPAGPLDFCVGGIVNSVDFTASVSSGGVGPYTYSWSPTTDLSPTTGDVVTYTPTAAGPYTITVTVTDANGCQGQASQSGTIYAAFTTAPIITASGELGSCPGATITLTVDNPADFLSLLWTPNGETTDQITVGAADRYCVFGFSLDGSGCYTETCISIDVVPTTIRLIGLTDNTCGGNGASGAIDVQTVGGCPAYTWTWTNAAGDTVGSSEDISGLADGQYTLVATDSLGQSAFATYIIATTSPELAITFTNIIGDVGGTATATVTGGTAPYTIIWTDPNGTTYSGATITGLFVQGIYRVNIVDANGCTVSDIVCISNVYSFGMSECEFKCFLQQMSCCQADMVYKMVVADRGGKDNCVEKVELMETYLELLECYYPEGSVIRAGTYAQYILTINSYSNGGTLVISLLGTTIVSYVFDTGVTFTDNLDNIVALLVASGLSGYYDSDGVSYANLIINAPAIGSGYNCVTMTVTNTGSNVQVLTTDGFTGGQDEIVADPPCLTDDEINNIMEQMRCICDGCDCTNLTTLTNDNLIF